MSVLHKPAGCKLCPYSYVGKGFCPDYYGPEVKIAMLLEAPGGNEILEHAPLVGKAGKYWTHRLIERCGYRRDNVLIANTIRCNPPDNKYPSGFLRRQAETNCRQYDSKHGGSNGELVGRGIREWHPNVYVITYHPAAILRTPALYKHTLRAVKFSFDLAEKGYRPCVLMGDKAMTLVAPYLKGGLKKWNRHYFELDGWVA